MSKNIIWAAAVGGAVSVSLGLAAVAADNPVAERQAAMKHVGAAMKDASGYVSGKTPWDAAAVKTLMGGVAADAKKLKGLYPAGSGADPKTEALPKVWETKADFDKKLSELGEAATAAGNAADAAAFKTSFMKLGATCKSCHDVYRKQKS
jgi:cytochrome c556